MAIGAAMNIQPSEMAELSWQEFQALNWHYAELHDVDSDDDIVAISPELYERELEKMAARNK